MGNGFVLEVFLKYPLLGAILGALTSPREN